MRRFCVTVLGLGVAALLIALPLWHVTRLDWAACQIHNTNPCDPREYLPPGSGLCILIERARWSLRMSTFGKWNRPLTRRPCGFEPENALPSPLPREAHVIPGTPRRHRRRESSSVCV